MLEYGKIYEIENFLTENEFNIVEKQFEEYNWFLLGGELELRNKGIPIRSFWYKELEGSEIESLFKTKIESLLNVKIKTERFYGNGQSHGQCGFVHEDNNEYGGSLVFYLHKNWLPYHGGHLVFCDGPNVTKSIFPKTNSAVMFNSQMSHVALEPTTYCLDMRVSIAYKFKVIK